MAYRLRVYAPTTGVNSLTIHSSSSSYSSTVSPAGTSTPCYDEDDLTFGVYVTASLPSGYTISQWVLNVDGSVSYQYGSRCTYSYSGSHTNVYIRLEVEEEQTPDTYYAYVSFNANGGSGAPSTVYGDDDSNNGYVQLRIPSTTPTRSNYTFLGWSLNSTATSASYYPNGTITVYGSTSYPGEAYTLWAVWQESSSDGYVWIYSNGWKKAISWIYSNGWKQAIPFVYNGGWKRGGS